MAKLRKPHFSDSMAMPDTIAPMNAARHFTVRLGSSLLVSSRAANWMARGPRNWPAVLVVPVKRVTASLVTDVPSGSALKRTRATVWT